MILSAISSLAALATVAIASNSFGGANHYFLATLDQTTRRSIITTLHNSGTRFIRTFVRPEVYSTEKGDSKATWSDVEGPMGTFVSPLSSVLDHYDDMLYDVYSVSGGQMKVLLGLHDANMIAGYTQPCDAYCQYMQNKGTNWGSFYSDGTIRNAFKTRLYNILRNYPSKNFGGKSWSQLSQVILAIDLENEPGVGGHDSKLVLAEEWVYNGGSAGKPADIASQGHALNALGIPWSYWDVMTGSESCSGCGNNEVSLDNSPSGACPPLQLPMGLVGQRVEAAHGDVWAGPAALRHRVRVIWTAIRGTRVLSAHGDVADGSVRSLSYAKTNFSATMEFVGIVVGDVWDGPAHLHRLAREISTAMGSVNRVLGAVWDGHALQPVHVRINCSVSAENVLLAIGDVLDGPAPLHLLAKETLIV
ncbi:hypothetical protein G7Y89_g12790 [Cudoniella acicularis]|uniref:Glycoside hydrolase family 5 domain-containing protein n=1 Tax=Cudoniella acicularis TaxID=354080 RepID=A0A8H4VWP0_9HELO|nr:hypothetical protein G7Y89_g12790 [Cudoniella acicularis]